MIPVEVFRFPALMQDSLMSICFHVDSLAKTDDDALTIRINLLIKDVMLKVVMFCLGLIVVFNDLTEGLFISSILLR